MPAQLHRIPFPRVSTTAHELGVMRPSVLSDLGGASSGQDEKGSILPGTLVLEGRTLSW
jgi:hypothetical protein